MNAPIRFRRLLPALSILLAGATLTAAPLRVALNPFTCDDVSQRSAVAATDFTAALQAQLGGDAALQWVERAELARVEQELKLGALGLVARNDAARVGRIAGADWAVYGRFTTNAPGVGRTLALELVDLAHAEPLGETNLPFGAPSPGPLRFSANSATAVASALTEWLRHEREASLARAGQMRVAVLPVMFDAGFGTVRSDLAAELSGALVAAATNAPLHTVRFSRAGRAVDEADMALTGLAETDHDAWLKVADWYVWGSVLAREHPWYDQTARVWNKDRIFTAELAVWDGRGQPLMLTNGPITNLPPAELSALFASRLLPLLRAHAAQPPEDSVRRAVAQAMRRQGESSLPSHGFWLTNPEAQAAWFRAVASFELASFFDPGDAAIRELWVRTRYAAEAGEISRSRFRFGRAALAAWGHHVERFGLEGAVTNLMPFGTPVRSVSEWYVASAADLFSPVEDERDDHPRDVGAKDLAAWYAEAARELAVRWLALGDRPEAARFEAGVIDHVLPASYESSPVAFAAERLRALRQAWLKSPPPLSRPFPSPVLGVDRAAVIRLCQDAGEPAVAERLFAAQATAATTAAAAADTSATKTNVTHAPVPLPRAEILDDMGEEARAGWLDDGHLEFPLPQAEADPEFIPFPSGKMERAGALAVVDDQPWFLATGVEEVAVAAGDTQLNRDVKAPTATFTRLWTVRLSAEGPQVERAQGAVSTNDFYALTRSENGLRLQDNRGTAGLFLPAGQSWQPLPQSPPARPANLTNVHVAPDLVQEVPGGWWVGGGTGLAWCATSGLAWDDFYDPPLHVPPSFWNGRLQGGGTPPPGDREPLRILNDLAERMQRRDRPPFSPGRLPGRVVALAPDGEFLWLVTDAFAPGSPVSTLLVLHVLSRRWVNSVVVPARVRAVGVTRTHVWLGVDASLYKGNGSPLWRYAKAPLLAVPEGRWQSQVVSGTEVANAMAGLSPGQRAIYGLFHGEARAFVELHRDEAPEDLPAEDLFLLAAAHDPRGLNEPEKLAKLAKLLVREHPASPFANLARKRWRAVLPAPAATGSATERAQEFMTRFDANHDGLLNEAEFGRLLFEEGDALGNLQALVRGLPPAVRANHLYLQLHRTDPRGISAPELAAALSTPANSPFPRRNPAVHP